MVSIFRANCREAMASTTATTTKKRKADEVADVSEDAERPPPALRKDAATSKAPDVLHLPAPVWGHVLDFMPYEEVRSALLVGKVIAKEAVKYVHTLNIMNPCQMDVPAARRFPNVEEVNILCLLKHFNDLRGDRENTLCEKTATLIVPFVSTFPKLQRVWAGGKLPPMNRPLRPRVLWYTYYPPFCTGPDNHEEIFRSLVAAFLGAFRARTLPEPLEELTGITKCIGYVRRCANNEREPERDSCSFCHDIARHFPIGDLLGLSSDHDEPEDRLCLTGDKLLRVLCKRKGANDVFERKSGEKLSSVLDSFLMTMASDFESLEVRYLEPDGMEQIDMYIAAGLDPKLIKQDELYEEIRIRDEVGDVFAKGTFEALVSRGFPLDAKDLTIVDERTNRMFKNAEYYVDKFKS